jgi:serine/threonine protein phosphatase 1
VTKISKVKTCIRLKRNTRGRDLVVGDLHGHRASLERELDAMGFDPGRDRVLSVGDLIDRGPESLATLSLLKEPWFHAVLGNHELMLLNFLGSYGSRVHSRKSYATGGGGWILDALARHHKSVERLAERIADLPLVLSVDDDVPYNVTHSSLPTQRMDDAAPFTETVSMHVADHITSSRDNIGAAMKSDLTDLQFGAHAVQISQAPLSDFPITYVGHSPVRDVTIHNSYVFIDQGVGIRSAKRVGPSGPTVIDHHEFSHWLGGVASAHALAADAPFHRLPRAGHALRGFR